MALNSVNTNIGAQIALASLNNTNAQMQATQKRISTGYRVADATDDGGAFAVAQRVRSDVSALTSANQELGNAKGLVGTALTGLKSISDLMIKAKGYLTAIGDQSASPDQVAQNVSNYKDLVVKVANAVDGSTFGGQNLLGSVNNGVTGTDKTIINNENGATSTIHNADNHAIAATLAGLIGLTFTRTAGADSWGPATAPSASAMQTSAQTSLGVGGAYDTALKGLSDQLNQTGADANFLESQISFNSSKIDSLNAGLGSLVDADLSKESAMLQSLQIKQQLGTQALSMANQAPQALLSLFK